jgi:hypothetical protein
VQLLALLLGQLGAQRLQWATHGVKVRGGGGGGG